MFFLQSQCSTSFEKNKNKDDKDTKISWSDQAILNNWIGK